jgi:hypothetical protein
VSPRVWCGVGPWGVGRWELGSRHRRSTHRDRGREIQMYDFGELDPCD